MTFFQEFKESIDCAFNIKGIVQNAEFRDKEQKIDEQKVIKKSPVRIKLIENLLDIWTDLTKLNEKILENKNFSIEIRL